MKRGWGHCTRKDEGYLEQELCDAGGCVPPVLTPPPLTNGFTKFLPGWIKLLL